jgi:isopenicillin N synthase-like dioxygenase
LQVQTWEGKWLDVPPVPYALVINVGQVLERMSAGAYPATTHRVLKTSRPTPRISIPFFFSPPLTTRLVPLQPEQLHPELRKHIEGFTGREIVSEVGKGDLHAEIYGKSAWKGIKRSHRPVWGKYYSQYDAE